MSIINSYKQFYAPDRKTWRKWLAKNHATTPGIWLIYYRKQSEKSGVSYNDAVEEALCFGWIDSTMRPLDESRYMQLFTPRKPKSVWSALNKSRVEKLIAAGLMTSAGLEKIDISKQNGSWEQLDHIEALIVPTDLAQQLKRSKKATAYFESLRKTHKKSILYWLGSAKRPETRTKRIEEIYHALKKEMLPEKLR
mgnify:CR=1 FL=1